MFGGTQRPAAPLGPGSDDLRHRHAVDDRALLGDAHLHRTHRQAARWNRHRLFVGFFTASLCYWIVERAGEPAVETANVTPRVPVIDIGRLRSADASERLALANEIGAARARDGFLHGHQSRRFRADLVAAVFAQSAAFFAQPLEMKARVGIEHSPAYRGYARIGYEQFDEAHPPDAKESFDIGPDQNLWPAGLRAFINAAALFRCLARADDRDPSPDRGRPRRRRTLLRAGLRARAYDRAFCFTTRRTPGEFDGTFARFGAAYRLRQHHLSRPRTTPAASNCRCVDGTWIGIEPTPDAFVCNIGDCLMRWSNDVYTSTHHRVVNRSGRALVACLPSCSGEGWPPKYAPVTYGEYLQRRLAAAYPLKAGLG